MPLVLEKINIKEKVGKACISSKKGEIIYNIICPIIVGEGGTVTLDFDEVETVSALFLNTAIGQLLEHLELEQVKNSIECINLDDDWHESIDLALSYSESYYRDSKYQQAVNDILQERSNNPESW